MSANPISSDWRPCKILPAQCWGSGLEPPTWTAAWLLRPEHSRTSPVCILVSRAVPGISLAGCVSSELWHAWFNSSTPSVNLQDSTSIFVLHFLQVFLWIPPTVFWCMLLEFWKLLIISYLMKMLILYLNMIWNKMLILYFNMIKHFCLISGELRMEKEVTAYDHSAILD